MAARGSGARRAQGHKDAMLERVRAWPTRAFATPGTVNTASQCLRPTASGHDARERGSGRGRGDCAKTKRACTHDYWRGMHPFQISHLPGSTRPAPLRSSAPLIAWRPCRDKIGLFCADWMECEALFLIRTCVRCTSVSERTTDCGEGGAAQTGAECARAALRFVVVRAAWRPASVVARPEGVKASRSALQFQFARSCRETSQGPRAMG